MLYHGTAFGRIHAVFIAQQSRQGPAQFLRLELSHII